MKKHFVNRLLVLFIALLGTSECLGQVHAQSSALNAVSQQRRSAITELVAGYKNVEAGNYDDALANAYKVLKMTRESGNWSLEVATLKLLSDIHHQIGDQYLGAKMSVEMLMKQLEMLKILGIRQYYAASTDLLIDFLHVDEANIFYIMAGDPTLGSFMRTGEQLQSTIAQALTKDLPVDAKKLLRRLQSTYKELFQRFHDAVAQKNVQELKQSSIQLMSYMDRSTDSILQFAPSADAELTEITRHVLRAYSKYTKAFWAKDKRAAVAALWETFEPISRRMKEDDGITLDEAVQNGLKDQLARFQEQLDRGGSDMFRETFKAASPRGIFNITLLHFMKADRSIEPVLSRYGYVTISELEPYGVEILEAVYELKKAEAANQDLVPPRPLPGFRFGFYENAIAVSSAWTTDGRWLYTGNQDSLRAADLEFSRLQDDIRQSRKLAQLNQNYSTSYLFLKRAVITYDLGELQRAAFYLRESLNLAQKTQNSELIWQTYFLMGLLHKRQGNIYQATSSFTDAARTIEGLRSSFRTENIRATVLDDKIFVYEFLIDFLNRTGRNADALAYVEKTKARILLDRFLDSRMRITPGTATNAFSKLQNSAQKIRELYNANVGELDDSELTRLHERIKGENEKYDAATEELRYSHSEFGSIITGETLSVADIQKLIDDRTTVLEYFIGADKIFIFVINKQGSISTATVPMKSTAFELLVQDFRRCVETESCDHRSVAKRLYEILIAPVENLVRGKRLCIVPHGLTHFLPFQALMKGDRFLIQDYQVFYSPSSTVLKFAFAKRNQAKTRILAVANPNGNLLSAEDEARAVAQLFPESNIFLRNRATKANVRSVLGAADVLHFATHANLNKENPLLSELRLADGSSLTVADIYGLELKASLATLSACQTNLGRLTSGDEVIGLARAFMFAGVPSIVSSLWQVRSDSTTKLMVNFYRKLNQPGSIKVDALRDAQLEMIRESGRYAHPSNWAAFVLVGDFQ